MINAEAKRVEVLPLESYIDAMHGKKDWCCVYIIRPEDNNTRHTTWQTTVPTERIQVHPHLLTKRERQKRRRYFVLEFVKLVVLMKE